MCAAKRQTSQEQETTVFDAAIKCIEETSLLNFTMAAIAKEANLSIGSVYKHVQSKEDVLLAVAVRMMKHQREVFSKTTSLPLTTPERLIGNMFLSPHKLNLYSFGVHLEMLICNEVVLERASSLWRERLMYGEREISEVFASPIYQAFDSGELMLDRKDFKQVMDVSIGLWSLFAGFVQVSYQKKARGLEGTADEVPPPMDPDHILVKGAQHLINTLPWEKPLDDQGIEKACGLVAECGYR